MKIARHIYLNRFLAILQVIAFLSTSVWSQDVYTRFRVEQGSGPITRTGNTGGSCEGIDVEKGFDLAAVYREAIDMAAVAVVSMDNYASDATVRANLQTWFAIKEDPTTHAVSAASVARFAKVRRYFQTVIDESGTPHNGANPALFCSEKWRWRTRWVHDSQTGKKTGNLLKDDFGVDWLVWSPLFKGYSQENIMCQGGTFAFTSHGEWQSITFCPLSFEYSRRKHTLAQWRNGQQTIADGTNMQMALSTPAVFLHELMHMVNRARDVKFANPSNGKFETAYGAVLTGSLALAAPDESANNADNYMWCATAMYLPQYDWSRVIAGKRTANGAAARRSISAEAHGRKHTHHSGKRRQI
ncbi:hypothetical protein N7471_001445 [Penicillium samsonianum]|uniref:uncharacterized protein n=1 Tax=Penicillium samsonianum TaxID=1882272 RepID=UPI0025466331|nr:uncharacterized protein N7471_001445 [Penicillium samsonianum]KAJ6150246.1 hypothetical protein N7471_001445 [Penicillium samsonianum]